MSLGNATFGGFIVGRASRLPSNDLPTQARRPRYIQKSKSKLLLVSTISYAYAVARLGADRASMARSLTPVVATLLAVSPSPTAAQPHSQSLDKPKRSRLGILS